MTLTFYSPTPKRRGKARDALLKRLAKNIDRTIVRTAANLPPDFGDLKDVPPAIPGDKGTSAAEVFARRFVDFWNRKAAEIETRLPGRLPIRMHHTGAVTMQLAPWSMEIWDMAIETLLFLSVMERSKEKYLLSLPASACTWAMAEIEATRQQAMLYDWMADELCMMLIPQEGTKRLASGRQSRWEKKLRNTKLGMAARREAFQRELTAIEAEDKRRQLIQEFRRDIWAKHGNAERQIRANRDYKDFSLSWWLLPEASGSADRIVDEWDVYFDAKNPQSDDE